LQELLDLLQDQRVAFESGRVMRFLVPDLLPDLFGFLRQGETAESLAKLGDVRLKSFVDRDAAESTFRCYLCLLIRLLR
jgi:hypothetical protein